MISRPGSRARRPAVPGCRKEAPWRAGRHVEPASARAARWRGWGWLRPARRGARTERWPLATSGRHRRRQAAPGPLSAEASRLEALPHLPRRRLGPVFVALAVLPNLEVPVRLGKQLRDLSVVPIPGEEQRV